ncbi:MAG TPA: hypothetical protein VGD78_11715 [Chthoniobacterales bacterium]
MQAQVLSRALRDRGFQPGSVRAVVALPGWCVLDNGPNEKVWVLNPINLEPLIRARPAVLSASEVNGIAKFLEERCPFTFDGSNRSTGTNAPRPSRGAGEQGEGSLLPTPNLGGGMPACRGRLPKDPKKGGDPCGVRA